MMCCDVAIHQTTETVADELIKEGWSKSLIAKFRKRPRATIFDKLVGYCFKSLVDCYATEQQVEANLDMRSVKHAREHNQRGGDSQKMTH